MNKEELLKQIRAENEENEPFEQEISSLSWKIGATVALAISLIVYYLEWYFWDIHNYALFITFTSILSVKFIIKAIKLKSVSSIIYSVIFSASLVIIVVIYIISFVNGWL